MSIPRTTHQWLKPLYDMLDGHGKRALVLGSPTSVIGMYGYTGVKQPTGVGATAGTTGATGTLTLASNGGTGTNFYTFGDLVLFLKQRGDIAT